MWRRRTCESSNFVKSELSKSLKMASFMDDEAVESDDEELSDEEERAKVSPT